MKLVCISDTHCSLQEYINNNLIPDGDVLIHAGDLTYSGTLSQMSRELIRLGSLPHKVKICVAGNHDFLAEENSSVVRDICKDNNIIYLDNEEVVIDGVKFWGSPMTPKFFDWAFMAERGDEISIYWDMIPEDTDVLITHGPPLDILDLCKNGHVGCYDLKAVVDKIKPKIHIFGHIHESHGEEKGTDTHFINAALMDGSYSPINLPIVVEI